jgi:cell wall-associated NlpC family hydrolase
MMLITLQAIPMQAGRGCCSSHGGEGGCSGGSALCKDGTISPSCGCQTKKAVDTATRYVHTRYQYGGSDQDGIDCSGLTQQGYPDYFGPIGPDGSGKRSAADQLDYLKKQGDEDIPPSDLEQGDLVYFNDGNGNTVHSAIVNTFDPVLGIGILAASSGSGEVGQQWLGKNGGLGRKLHYGGGGRPR